MIPQSVYLPFNRDCLRGTFTPAKRGTKPPEAVGHWLIVQDQNLLVLAGTDTPCLPQGARPAGCAEDEEPFWLGTLGEAACWVSVLPAGAPLPAGLRGETLIPMKGTGLPDELLSLGGMAMQALHWQSTSGHCPRCGGATTRIEGEWGKKCGRCGYEHYPHLHPCVIVLVRDGQRVLLARKATFAPGRYALVAGFVDNGESLEGCVAREVKEEVGVDVGDITYVGSQNWPFPSQLMIGFVATYAGGEVVIDHDELEDARWFDVGALPPGPSRHSIAGYIIEHYARP
ncbi:MAG TPA: NAD(+) diphosphatase [Candidatus Limnocylindria bacterium]|nr:NAD(+) diphosphatase [Candidatus Limnocylindria bacterium]